MKAGTPAPVKSIDVPVGVAGRRDYPASTRRDTGDVARSSRGSDGRSVAKPAGDATVTHAGPIQADTKGGNPIAEQRVDADRSQTEARGNTEPNDKPRRATAKTTKADRPKVAKPATAPVPGARLSTYAEEAAELLAGLSPDRRRRKTEQGDRSTSAAERRAEPAKD